MGQKTGKSRKGKSVQLQAGERGVLSSTVGDGSVVIAVPKPCFAHKSPSRNPLVDAHQNLNSGSFRTKGLNSSELLVAARQARDP